MRNGVYLKEEYSVRAKGKKLNTKVHLELVEVVDDVVILRDIDTYYTCKDSTEILTKSEFLAYVKENGHYVEYLGTI